MPTTGLRYDPQGVYLPEHGLAENTLTEMSDRLGATRAEVLADAELWASGGDVPAEKIPLDAGFIELPNRLLDEYRSSGDASELGQIIATAQRLREHVDRVVCLGIGGSYMGARALFEACAHPHHNELARARRDGWPRIYFSGNNVDNDAMAGTLDLLRDCSATSVD
ncbi:MAG: hypothetical protein KDA63_01300, partial [Planctomycetales bacterium]|nr:hypothetical protein [Planctomycetales bacterium]